MQNDSFKSGFNFFFIDLMKQGEYITIIETPNDDELIAQKGLYQTCQSDLSQNKLQCQTDLSKNKA
jgi:hypothetical protein